MPYILSKLSNSQIYTKWAQGQNGINHIAAKVEIKGGADVINKKTLETPNGVVTEVTDNDLDILKQNPDFIRHVEGGYISIIDNKITEDKAAEKAKDMPKDNSAQKTPKDFKKSKGKAKPAKEEEE